MAKPKPKEEKSKRQELREDSLVTLYARAWGFFEENRKLVYAGAAAFVLIIVLVIAYFVYQQQQQEEAQQHLGQIVTLYEQGDYRAALDGTGDRLGLRDIADQYSRTQSGNMAAYYAGDAHYRLGELDEALEYFQRHSKERNIVGASAIAAEATIHEEQGDFEQAGDRFRRAATYYENDATSPQYLIQSGRAYEEAGLYERALESYQMIQEEFPNTPEADEVDTDIARMEARLEADDS